MWNAVGGPKVRIRPTPLTLLGFGLTALLGGSALRGGFATRRYSAKLLFIWRVGGDVLSTTRARGFVYLLFRVCRNLGLRLRWPGAWLLALLVACSASVAGAQPIPARVELNFAFSVYTPVPSPVVYADNFRFTSSQGTIFQMVDRGSGNSPSIGVAGSGFGDIETLVIETVDGRELDRKSVV